MTGKNSIPKYSKYKRNKIPKNIYQKIIGAFDCI